MEKNLDITNQSPQSLATSLNRGSTVVFAIEKIIVVSESHLRQVNNIFCKDSVIRPWSIVQSILYG